MEANNRGLTSKAVDKMSEVASNRELNTITIIDNSEVNNAQNVTLDSTNLTVVSSEQANQSLSKEYMERQYSIWHLEERYDDLKSKRRYDFTEKDEQDFEYRERSLGDAYYLDYLDELNEENEDN
jgi:hypothetical protein